MPKKETFLWVDSYKDPRSEFVKQSDYTLKVIDPEVTNVIWIDTFEEFKGWIYRYGVPEIVAITYHVNTSEILHLKDTVLKEGTFRDVKFPIKNGKDFISWLSNYCMSKKYKLPILEVHGNGILDIELKTMCNNLNNYAKNMIANERN